MKAMKLKQTAAAAKVWAVEGPKLAVKAIALAVAAACAAYTERYLVLYDVAPETVKALHEAQEKAFKALQENIDKSQQKAMDAIEQVRKEGTITGDMNKELKELGETGKKLSDELVGIKERMLAAEQKMAKKPGPSEDETKSLGQIVAESEEFKAAAASKGSARSMAPVTVGSFHKAAFIANATLNNDQPLVSRLRLPGIIAPGLRRLTIRDLLPQTPVDTNLIEFAKETLFTNNAGPQGGATSPTVTGGEGEIKPQSDITFELASTPVITFAHWIAASRQVLSDAKMLQGYIDGRLRYGLQLAEEAALLNGDGTAGTLNGLMNNATAFAYGSTNQTVLDTLLWAQTQVSLSEFDVTGYVLHPIDWTQILLLKDTQGRYLFTDPHGTEQPRVWGKPVVATQAQTRGQFLAGAFNLGAEIFDREDATVRVAEQHADFFVRNLVAILAEERLAIAVYRSQAFVKGALSNAG